ncbi:TetR/AcrR family transcriptional regulator C-terminal domain-containing protein [Devosia oryziradicis]|uniref:TetR/AcrR family transcriptional regulator C-terminal domain-containing protein n=1 Tax=Devosia oryziradicis TaxID=2801335 RepID=A0ABX7BXE6_9HYPH|nr:TetR/AcrR family transcriptional regulator C-terminal domain-containing protein [Devosia oryziradicis]QQR35095.1 TetR/AcrR family transcriptional regulator C-terminal domain-containing protein [Devosia oryziradicis]
MAIDRDRIVDEAILLLNEVGIDKLSTRKLAERLGVQQPALYWHFKSKSALLDAVNSEMLARYHTHRLPSPGEDWVEFTLETARSMRRTLLTVRDGARIAAGTRPSTTDFADAERQLRLYVEAGFSAEEALHISISVARYVVGYVLEEQGERERMEEEEGLDGGIDTELAPFPILAEAFRSLEKEGSINTEAAFERGLGYMVDGMVKSQAAKG